MGRKPCGKVIRADPEPMDPTSHVDLDGQSLLPSGRRSRDLAHGNAVTSLTGKM